MKKFLVVLAVVAMVFSLQAITFASPAGIAAAENYVRAFESGNWAQAKAISTGAALSFVEYCEIAEAETGGVKSILTSQSEVLVNSEERIRVVYIDSKDNYQIRNVSVINNNGVYVVNDDKPLGSEWVNTGYSTDSFKSIVTMENVRVTVIGYLEVGNLMKIDMLVENISSTNTAYVFPSLDGFTRLQINGQYNLDYYSVVSGFASSDKPLAPGQSMRSSLIVQNFQYDERVNSIASQLSQSGVTPSITGFSLVIPVGPLTSVVISF